MLEKISNIYTVFKRHFTELCVGTTILLTIVEYYTNKILDSKILPDILYLKIPININFKNIPILYVILTILFLFYMRHLALYFFKMNYPYILRKKKKKLQEILKKDEFNMFSSIQFYKYKITKDEDLCKIVIRGLEFLTNEDVAINGVLQSKCEFAYDIYQDVIDLNKIQDAIKTTKEKHLAETLKKSLQKDGKELKFKIIDRLHENMKIQKDTIVEESYALYRVLHIISSILEENVRFENKKFYLDTEFREQENQIKRGKKTGLMGNILQSYAYFFNNDNTHNPNKTSRLYATFRLDTKKSNIICLVSFNGKNMEQDIQFYINKIMIEIREILYIKNENELS